MFFMASKKIAPPQAVRKANIKIPRDKIKRLGRDFDLGCSGSSEGMMMLF
jgi:hypothetical protein